ncbi:MAG: aminopeptidase [Lentimicrobiaceae bacterium]|nr:aminopeptidase [Lentimicrobiaceae bacterium]
MKRAKTIIMLALAFIIAMPANLSAQKKGKKEAKDERVYQITDEVVVPHTSVKNQAQSGTCWCFAGIGMVEAEILRKYNVDIDLSEMYLVRWAYTQKFEKFVRMQGTCNFSPGGEVFDVLYAIENQGMMTEDAYNGLVLGEDRHQHGELHSVLAEYGKIVNRKLNGKISKAWDDMVQSILDVYLGKTPESFEYEGVKYDAKSFANKYPININDYVQIGAFTFKPNYEPYIMPIQDNWTNTLTYNMTLDELMNELDNALNNGYTVGWAQDVSDKGFSRNAGVGVVLENDVEKIRQSDPKKYKDMSDDEILEGLYKFESIMPEKDIDDAMHQEAYDNGQTTDDHSMLIVGIAHDQNGNKYYKVKNSWSPKNGFDGYWYCSEPFVRLHTMFFTLNKEALSDDMKAKLNF